MNLKLSLISAVLFGAFCISPACAETFQCEVLSVEGSAVRVLGNDRRSLREGDLLDDGDVVETGPSAVVILAFDKLWKNVAQIEESSVARVQSVLPPVLYLKSGGLFAKLAELPEGSTFSVETPTAIAAARGTEYRTLSSDAGTEVFNVSDSDVYVFGKDSVGDMVGAPVILAPAQKTRLPELGKAPAPPVQMTDTERGGALRVRERVLRRVQENVSRGRVGKIADVGRIRQFLEERKAAGQSSSSLVSMDNVEKNDRRRQDGRMIERSERLLDLMQKAQDYRPTRDLSFGTGGAPILPSNRILQPFPAKAPMPMASQEGPSMQDGPGSQNETGEGKKPDEKRPAPKPAPRKN